MADRFEFQTEAKQLLDLMIHSVYSNRDIFLRELISNSSDALDKLRVESLTEDGIAMTSEPEISIDRDSEARTLSVSDNGIGMSRQELIDNVGTIARSGTKQFMEMLQSRKGKGETVNAELIGQFGVGFYSVFMVADRVELTTRRAGDEKGWKWISTGDGTYEITEESRDSHGTTVTLHLKSEEDLEKDYTEEWTIRSIVKKYSDFVTYPIVMTVERDQKEEVEEASGEVVGSDGRVRKRETLNAQKAIWRRSSDDVKKEEYEEFYNHTFYDPSEPLSHIHFRAEGTQEYYSLLYIPAQPPYDLYMPEQRSGMHLYVKRVFITDEAKELLPGWLRFVRGVVDSEDLPLNISREVLQQNRQIAAIRKRLVSKTLEELDRLRQEEIERYRSFWSQFGPVLKEGAFQDPANAEKILGLGLFRTTASEQTSTLDEVIERLPEGEETIWYLTSESRSVAENSPHLESFRKRGVEVLLLTDRVDAVWTGTITEYRGTKLKSVTAAEADQEREATENGEEQKKRAQEAGPVLTAIKDALGDRISEVRLSSRLTESPAVVVTPEGEMNAQLRKMMEAMGQEMPPQKRVLEINPDHSMMNLLKQAHAEDQANRIAALSRILYDGALLAEGELPEDPATYARLVAQELARGES